MQEYLFQLFKEYPHAAILISLAISILVAVAGVIPSVFITAANMLFFGFIYGTLISFAGEAAGAGIAFFIYRKGFKQRVEPGIERYPRVKKLVQARGKEAFYLVFSLRLIPFVPSGLITFAAAMGNVSFGIFLLASSAGKLPALLMEAWSVKEVTEFGITGKLILIAAAVALVYYVVRKKLTTVK